jgi:alcohol dehydrogenase (cytochrome c)
MEFSSARFKHRNQVTSVAIAVICLFNAAGSASAAETTDNPANWTEYHRDYRGWRFSPLEQITPNNVKRLKVAWIHQPGDITQGLQATPIIVDGVVYYIGPNNRVFAVDGATGKEIWHYYTELDPIVSTMLFNGYNRGVSVGKGKVFFGTLDGRIIALDQKTGKHLWEVQLTDPKKCNGCNFTSPPTLAGDVLIAGPTGGDLAQRGRLYALNADSGERMWNFELIKDDPASWPGDSATYGGGGAWLPGQYDPKQDLFIVGTSNAAPDFDGTDRKGDNLYAATVLAIEPKTGKLRWYHQEVPHDVWDYDSAYEFLFLNKNNEDLVVHLNKGGYVFVMNRKTGKVVNTWKFAENVNWVEKVDPKTGELSGRNEPEVGNPKVFCPSVLGARSWNAGAYSPKTGLWYTNAHEFCNRAAVGKQDPKTAGMGPYFGVADFGFVPPPGGKASARLEAVDPLTGKRAWTVEYPLPSLGAVLVTGGDLVFNGDSRGHIHAYHARTGKELWNFNSGSGIRGGISSYAVGGKQYIVASTGFGSLFPGFASGIFPEFKESKGGAALIAFTLE